MKKPSVTELISMLDKPALLKWANKLGLSGVKLDDYRKEVLSKGLSFHKQIELYIKDKTDFESDILKENYLKYFSNKIILESEKNIETKYFIGRYDIKIEYNSRTYICDFKTDKRKVYFENILQLAGYKMAEKCDGVGIISIPTFRYIPISVNDFSPYEQILILLSQIYNIKQTL